MIKWEESVQIYNKWLAGADIKDLAREFHHWRYVIEEEIRWQARRQVRDIQSLNLQLQARLGERDDAFAAIARWEVTRRIEMEGIEATTKWGDDYTDSIAALNNKAKLLSGISRFVFDENGLLLDVKVFEPEQKSEGVQN